MAKRSINNPAKSKHTKMRVSILKQPIVLIFTTFAILLSLFIGRLLIFPYQTEIDSTITSPLGILIDSIGMWSSIAAAILSVSLIIINSLLLVRIISHYSAVSTQSFLPIVFYIAIACGIAFPIYSPSIPFLTFLMLCSIYLMITSFKDTLCFQEMILSGFYLGLTILIYPPLLLYVLSLPIFLSLYKRSWREYVGVLLGLISPFIILGFCWWVAGYGHNYIITSFGKNILLDFNFSLESLILQLGGLPTALACFSLFLTLIAITSVLIRYNSLLVKARKFYLHSSLLLIIATIIFLFDNNILIYFSLISVACVPLIHTLFARWTGATSIATYILFILVAIIANIL